MAQGESGTRVSVQVNSTSNDRGNYNRRYQRTTERGLPFGTWQFGVGWQYHGQICYCLAGAWGMHLSRRHCPYVR